MSGSEFSATVGQTQFLELFVAQLKYQDPLAPIEQQQFLDQLSQLSSLENLERLNAGQQEFNDVFQSFLQLQLLNSGTDLLGRTVTWGPDGQSGVATEVRQDQGQVLVRVGEHLIPVASIESVTDGGGQSPDVVG